MNAFAGMLAKKYKAGRVVRRSKEFRRIEELPRRSSYPDSAELLTIMLQRDDLPLGADGKAINPFPLRQVQAWALAEMAECRGLLGSLEVGSGKTLVTLLAARMLGARRPLLLIPASVREKTIQVDIPEYSRYYKMPENLRVLSYEQLSQVKQADVLERWMPDLVIADEVHRLKRRSSGVTRRVLRYYDQHKRFHTGLTTGDDALDFYRTMFVGVSGTITKRSLRDYAHLAALALGEGSPLPNSFMDLDEMADALDEGVDEAIRPNPGALLTFCRYEVRNGAVVYLDTPREGFRRRLVETKGYISTESPKVAASLVVSEFPRVDVPNEVKVMFAKIRATWKTPGTDAESDEIINALDMARHLKELAMGFYYRWKWANGVVDREWLLARRRWRSFVRMVIKESGQIKWGRQTFDTELQVARACANGSIVAKVSNPLSTGDVPEADEDVYAKWRAIRKRSVPETEAVWVSDFMLQTGLKWLQQTHASKDGQGILWTEHTALLEKFRTVWPRVYGAGENEIIHETQTCVASLKAHGTGKNLQTFCKSLFLAVPRSGVDWEQTLGRMHRSTQLADEVSAQVSLHVLELWESFRQARRDAAYIQQTTGQQQRLQFASVMVTPEPEVVARALRRPKAWPGHAAWPGCRGDQDPLWCGDMDKIRVVG